MVSGELLHEFVQSCSQILNVNLEIRRRILHQSLQQVLVVAGNTDNGLKVLHQISPLRLLDVRVLQNLCNTSADALQTVFAILHLARQIGQLFEKVQRLLDTSVTDSVTIFFQKVLGLLDSNLLHVTLQSEGRIQKRLPPLSSEGWILKNSFHIVLDGNAQSCSLHKGRLLTVILELHELSQNIVHASVDAPFKLEKLNMKLSCNASVEG